MENRNNTQNYFSKTRLETFSDGIFAIIITLLVLEIKVPEISNHHSMFELIHALWLLLPKIISWMVSFLIICVIWVNHHRIFEPIKIITHSFFWLNANLLLWCAFIPFPTAMLGDYLTNPVSVIFFGIILAFMSFSFYLIRINIIRNTFILQETIDLDHYKKANRRSLIFGPVLYLAGAVCSFIHPYLSLVIYLFIPLYFIFYNSFQEKNT